MSKPTIVPISGKARHGKDTTAELIKKELEAKGKKVLIVHYADYLKFICKAYFGWNGEKDEDGRTLLQQVGTDKIRAKEPDFWVNIIEELISVLGDEFDFYLIPDTRFPNEIDFFRQFDHHVIAIRVVRPFFKSELTEEQLNHPSETALDDYEWFDGEIFAQDMAELEADCKEVANWLIEQSVHSI